MLRRTGLLITVLFSFLLAGCDDPPTNLIPEITGVRADADGSDLTLHANIEPYGWQNFRVFLRYARPVDDWVTESTLVDMGTQSGSLSHTLPDGDKFRGATIQYQWWVEYALPNSEDYATVSGEQHQLHIPTFMVLVPLTDTEVDILFDNTLVIDGNLQISTHANQVDSQGNAIRDDTTTTERIRMIHEDMGVRVISRTVSTDFDTLITLAESADERSDLIRIQNSYDVEIAHRSDTLGVIFYSQKHYPLTGDVDRLDDFYDEGLRIFQIAYGSNDSPNQTADEQLGGGTGNPATLGLTPLGEQAVDRMNQLHMAIDCSHCNSQTIADTVARSTFPVLANHGAAQALTSTNRNLTDDDLDNIAGSGGVIGMVTIGPFIEIGPDGPGVDDFVSHVNYTVDRVGIDHVGLASDSYINGWPTGSQFHAGPDLSALDRWKTVIQALSEEQDSEGNFRYSVEDLRKLMGWNFLRVYQETMHGHTKPLLHDVQLEDDTVTFSWEPSSTIGVPEPFYSVRVYAADEETDFELIGQIDTNETQVSRPVDFLLDDQGEPYFKYQWFVRSENEVGFTNSRWGFFLVP